jgi:uncharacterized protein (TIGR00725 family)
VGAPVVAVFGSSVPETMPPATSLGRAVAEQRCVLLTGGGRKPAGQSVKEQAMEGCRAAGKGDAPGFRVGVLGTEPHRVGFEVSGTEAILGPGLGDGRNYLNAAMCDVAVALPGGRGTHSEVAFALALGRPVVLLGDWRTPFPNEMPDSRRALVDSARPRVPGTDGSDLSTLVTAAYAAVLGTAELRVERRPLEHDADDVVATAVGMVDCDHLPGDVPRLVDRPDLDPVAAAYRRWLADLRR